MDFGQAIRRLGLPDDAEDYDAADDTDRYAIKPCPNATERYYLYWRDGEYVLEGYSEYVHTKGRHISTRVLWNADDAYRTVLTIAGCFVDINNLPSNRGADATWRTYPGHFENNH